MKLPFKKIYELVAKIPEGKIITYGRIAGLLGHPRGARIVAWAMKAAPSSLNLPCHRVINKSGLMAPDHVFGGPHIQRSKLESEGVTFTSDGRVNLDRHLWRIEIQNK